ncbi:MAG: PIN domain-containing protein [Chitinivibrionales bacterium]|nr:PIN domain-containing protein [Chitinivibrionales bacterium]
MNKNTVFVDTGAWFAIADSSDQFHQRAVEHLKKLTEKASRFVTSNLVIHETVLLLARRLSKKAAGQFLDMVYTDEIVTIIQSTESMEQKAHVIFKKYTDQDFSITDCVSFVIMKDARIKEVFTFDKHFKVMKFSVFP